MFYQNAYIVFYCFTLLPILFAGAFPLIPHYLEEHLYTRRNISSNTVAAELGPQLSDGSLVFGSDYPTWDNETWRWNIYARPDVQVIVKPAAESDFAKIVKYCNRNSFEFLIRNRGHGLPTSLSSFSGVQINVEFLQGIKIAPDNKTATMQAGTYGGDVIDTLWKEGLVTTTGSAPCVGVMGPALGGGHSRYEGLYGMVMDNIIHYNVVLANGTELGVNATSHPDLLWALKGAGHNFAIVTSFVKEIYPGENWYLHTYTWTQDKLETVFEELNKFAKSANGTTPPKMGVNYGAMIMNPNISTTEAVLEWGFNYAGPAEEAEQLLAPFNAIGAVMEGKGEVSYPEIAGVTEYACPSAKRIISTSLALEYNITTERAHYNQYLAKLAQYPELTSGAYLYYEGYATAGFQDIPSESTAYPHRDQNLILVFFSEVPQGSDELREPASIWAKETVDLWNEGQSAEKPKVYVNYAGGWDYQTVPSIYGYEPWRLEKLHALKAEYDPENRFRYYVPILPEAR